MTQDELVSIAHYDPATGVFTNRKSGKALGRAHYTQGYLQHTIDKKTYGLHRLAFLYIEGTVPAEVDHINHVRSDNRWCNLRGVSRKENCLNTSMSSVNKSGIVGVSWNKAGNIWVAHIQKNRKQIYLGQRHDFFEACCVRKSAERKHGFHRNHGEKL